MDSQGLSTWSRPLIATGVGLSGFTSGILASLSLVGIPTILISGTNASLLAGWKETLDKGVKVGPSSALVAAAVHLANAYINRNAESNKVSLLGAAAVSTIAIVPYTILFLGSTNHELFKREYAARDTTLSAESGNVELVKKWGRLNLIRALLPAAGAVIACLAL